MKKKLVIFTFILTLFGPISAQRLNITTVTDSLKAKIESASTFTNGDNAPFWIMNNKYGIASERTNSGYMRASIFNQKYWLDNSLSLVTGADLLTSYNLSSSVYLQQLFVDLSYKKFILSVGMKERQTLFKNQELSSGGLTLSNNARPIPQIEFATNDYITLPFLGKSLHLMGGISFGRFLDDNFKEKYASDKDYSQHVLYHRKYGFLKIEKPNKLWNVIIGAEMGTQWGGYKYDNNGNKISFPSGFKDMVRVIFVKSGGSNATESDQINKLGNTFGSYHFVFNLKRNNYNLKAYHEHYFEDKSGMFFQNFPDGLYGLEINLRKKQIVSLVLFEYLYTKNQSGPYILDENNQLKKWRAADNYYNNGEYVSLTNYGYGIGNPLLVSPIYNDRKTLRYLNNRVTGYHAGISGYFSSDITYKALATYTRSYGTPPKIPKNAIEQFSALFEITYASQKLNSWIITVGGALDHSKLVGDNLGMQLKVSKLFQIK